MKNNKPQILLVDDSSKNLQVLASTLETEKYAISAARDGCEALSMIEKKRPDLILLDIMMPNMDGYETCERLKAEETTKEIPVIFLTAKTQAEDIVKGFSMGAVDYITKPFNSIELNSKVRNHIELKKNKENLKQTSDDLRSLLHILCHDLANPIGQIMGIIDADSQSPGFLLSMREAMYTSAKNGLDTIELVRQMTAIQEQKYVLDLSYCNLQSMIRESLHILDHRLNEKNIKINLNIRSYMEVFVERTSFVNSIVNNLLSNAIKFSFIGSSIDISAIELGENIKLVIQDYGIGMPEKLVHNLFNLNKVTSRPGTKGERGTGYGMPLVKKFMDLYDGGIHIYSIEQKRAKNHGTRVELLLNSNHRYMHQRIAI